MVKCNQCFHVQKKYLKRNTEREFFCNLKQAKVSPIYSCGYGEKWDQRDFIVKFVWVEQWIQAYFDEVRRAM